ncbi:MAG: hypothetical protein QOE54_2981 [Streptosporangiaceae bacterium]|nr:hypothetical protein [Streptosporangiaceae bacterium]MDX6430615.1 hypothetical protein [Streptosporangiaceae bacterium]
MRTVSRSSPVVIGVALVLTIATDLVVLTRPGRPGPPAEPAAAPAGLSVPVAAQVAPLGRRFTPSLLVAAGATLPTAAVARVRRARGVVAVEVVDAARTLVAGRPVGVLGVDPSTFRALTPQPVAESDPLWHNVAAGDLVVSPSVGQDGTAGLGSMVSAGSPSRSASARIGAYAAMGITDVDAVVSHAQARSLGLPDGNALIVSAPTTDLTKLRRTLQRLMPREAKIAPLGPGKPKAAPAAPVQPLRVATARSPVIGDNVTDPMRALRVEIDARLGPFPVIGCFRPGDPQDHGTGRACDFMESTGGRMPSPDRQANGDQVAAYATANAARLGIKYVIWRQRIWNPGGSGWRPMGDRGSITQNHYDHVHISVY